MWQYSNPVKIIFSDDFSTQVFQVVSDYKDPNILVITYDWFKSTEDFKKLEKELKKFEVYTNIEENPSFNSCQSAINEVKNYNIDIIIAIGGGSVIDTAKAIRVSKYKNCFNIKDLFRIKGKRKKKPIFIAIPTTHGTGSELTMWATIWDKKNKKKYSLSEYENYPDYAIYDVSLMINLPISISLSTTLDALSHAFEAIWNKNKNPISTQYAIQAIKVIVENIGSLKAKVSINTRKNIILASMYSGLAFSNTKTAAAHSISYPLSLYFNIPHGIACSMPLYPLLKVNSESIQEEIEKLLYTIQIESIEEMLGKVFGSVKIKIPFTLREYGVKEEDLKWLVDESFNKGRMDNNIIDLNRNNVLKILKEIY